MSTHRLSIWSLVFGLIFLAAAGVYLAVREKLIDAESLAYAVPVTLISIGVIGIALTLWRPKEPRG